MTSWVPDITGRLNQIGVDDPSRPVRLGLLGGTFDPIHLGHLRIAEEVREKLDLAGVLFIPTGKPVFKKDRIVTNAQVRLGQVVQATATNPYFGVSSLEIDRPGDTFTIDTLRALREYYPSNVSLYFIVGSDAAASLPLWREAAELSQLAVFVLAGERPGEETQEEVCENLDSLGGFTLEFVPVRALDISSSEIRSLAEQGKTVRYLVPECIRNEVQEQYGHLGASCNERLSVADSQGSSIDALSDEYFEARKEELRGRVSEKRFQHSLGVSSTAQKLAEIYGVDVEKARLAGILHDWDKCYNDEEIKARAWKLGLQESIDPGVIEALPATLHGMTAARALEQEYEELPSDVIQAIARHTIANTNMDPLDMVIYIADALEPHRNFGEIDELRQFIGQVPLEELFFKVFRYWTELLLERERSIYPDTIRVWNTYATKLHPREGFTGHDRRD